MGSNSRSGLLFGRCLQGGQSAFGVGALAPGGGGEQPQGRADPDRWWAGVQQVPQGGDGVFGGTEELRRRPLHQGSTGLLDARGEAGVLQAATDRTAPVAVFERMVAGRPTGYSGGVHEQGWKAAVREAFSICSLPTDGRVQVDLEFLLGPEQRGRNEPDLDNLIKATVDALDGVLGPRPGTGTRAEADDVRVDPITASKRPVRAGEAPGARIAVAGTGT